MISGNELPSLRTVDAAIRARVLVIPFKEWIPEEEQNLNLLEDLKAEWPAILQWAIEGAIAWDKEGLQVPESIRRASEEYLDSEDIIREFIRECVVGKPGGWVAVKDLHRVFQEWRTRSGSSTHLGSQTALTRALRERSYEIVHKASGNGLSGYSLRSSDADTSDTSSNYRRPAEESGR